MTTWTLVTGASSGIGRAFAEIAAKEGRNLVIAARRTDKLEEAAGELREMGAPDIRVVGADLAKMEDCERLWREAAAAGTVDILVNNAGLGAHGLFAEGDWDREKTSIDVNITALTYLMKQAVQHMLEAGSGRIVNVASVASFLPGPNMAVYHATKSYVLSLSEAVAEELSGTDVTVTALCPGATESEFFDSADMHDVNIVKRSPKLPSSKEVAEAGWIAARGGKRVVVPGAMNKVLAFAPRVTPRALLMKTTKFVMGKS